jgi:predicted acetylornithine/succinylornithine family transaminase
MSLPIPAEAALSPAAAVIELERAHLLKNYARYPLVLKRGRGCWMWGLDGKRYLDLITGIGVNALGHAHPRITRVLREQAALMIHCSNLYYHEYQGPLAAILARTSGLERTFFCNSGTEAVEGAIKMMHSHGRKLDAAKHEIVAVDNSFHGRTIGALALTGQQKYRADFEPLMPGVRFVPAGDLNALRAAVGPNTAGIIVEVVQGEGGIRPAGEAWLREARRLAGEHDALLAFDEIQCGIGRLGTYFAYQQYDPIIQPDIAVLAKPISCGLPLGAIVANEKAAATIAPGMHGSTFGGGPLACRVAIEFYSILDELLPNINEMGEYFRAGLREIQQRHSFVKEVRGAGLMLGVELDFPCKHLVPEAMSRGLLLNVTSDTVIRMLPPYIISKKEIDRALVVLGRMLAKAKAA